MVPAVAVSMPSRQPTDQLYQQPGKKRCVQSQACTERLHRTALDAQGHCAEAEQRGLPKNVRPGASNLRAKPTRGEIGGAKSLDLRRGAAQDLSTGSVFAPSPTPCTGGVVLGQADLTRRSVMSASVLLAAIARSGQAGG
jgi:hypothetical protein